MAVAELCSGDGWYQRARSMHSESTASVVPSRSATSKAPAATPPASSSRMSSSKRARIATIWRNWRVAAS